MQKKQAKIARKNAERTAKTQRDVAQAQAGRVAREQAEAGVANKQEGERQRGVVYNAENKGAKQIAALSRQVDRDIQSNQTAIEYRVASANGSVRDAFANIAATQQNAIDSNQGPSGLEYTSMSLTIAGTIADGGQDIKGYRDEGAKW
jgi:hypothetical protein